MQQYVRPDEDGLPMRAAGDWTEEKLDYLGRYVDMFVTSMRKRWRVLCYIDLFAGPGKLRLTKGRGGGQVILGSPLRILQHRYAFNHYFLVEKDTACHAALQARVQASNRAARVRCLLGDANMLVEEVLDEIGVAEPWPDASLSLAFLDPEGLELHWQTVAALARKRRMDLVIYYPQSGLDRTLDNPSVGEKISRWIGTTEWQQVYEEARCSGVSPHSKLVELYCHQLAGLGYKVERAHCGEVTEQTPAIHHSVTRAPLYRLLFASKCSLGQQFWTKVLLRDPSGQRRLRFD